MFENELYGNKSIKRIIRPPRIAFIVKTREHINKFISISSHSWGGRYFLALPVNSENDIDKEWLDILRKYSPDSIYTFCPLERQIELNLFQCSFDICQKIDEQHKIEILYDKDDSNLINSPEFFGQPILNFFLRDGLFDENAEKMRLEFIPNDDKSLFLKARFGVLDKNVWIGWQHSYITPEYRKFDLADKFENLLDLSSQDIFSCITNRRKKTDEISYSLLEYTLCSLNLSYIDRLFDTTPKSETNQIIIISDGENIEDFCLFWAIRGQRYNLYDPNGIGPLWIDRQLFISNYKNVCDLYRNRNEVYVICEREITNELTDIPSNWHFQNNSINEFYNEYFYIGNSEDTIVFFNKNRTQFKLLKTDTLKFFEMGRNQSSYLELQIPDISIPKLDTLFWDKHSSKNYTVTKSGLRFTLFSNKENIFDFEIPSAWNVLETYSHMLGKKVAYSDKGKIGNELIRMVGGEENLWIFSHPGIIELILEMSNIKKLNKIKNIIREKVTDSDAKKEILSSLPRKSIQIDHFSYQKIKKILAQNELDLNSIKRIIEFFLYKGLIRQGITIKCQVCYSPNWISIDDFKACIKCSGCLNEIKIPFGIEKIDWEYELNTLLSAEIDQGMIVHLLTGYYLLEKSKCFGSKEKLYGLYYGLCFLDEDAVKNTEVDIAIFKNGKLLLGECKVSGKGISEQEVQDLIAFAKAMKVKQVYLSCLAHKEEFQNIIEKNETADIELVLLGNDDLQNMFPGISTLIQIQENKADFTFDRKKYFQSSIEALNY